jgi:hypothetical protein
MKIRSLAMLPGGVNHQHSIELALHAKRLLAHRQVVDHGECSNLSKGLLGAARGVVVGACGAGGEMGFGSATCGNLQGLRADGTVGMEAADKHGSRQRIVKLNANLGALRDADHRTGDLRSLSLLGKSVDTKTGAAFLLGIPGGLHQFQMESEYAPLQLAGRNAIVVGTHCWGYVRF